MPRTLAWSAALSTVILVMMAIPELRMAIFLTQMVLPATHHLSKEVPFHTSAFTLGILLVNLLLFFVNTILMGFRLLLDIRPSPAFPAKIHRA